MKLATGEQSIFNGESTATDSTHSQLAKDHYDNELNEIAGRVAVRIVSCTTTRIIQLWQPGNSVDLRPTLAKILEAFHHPFNASRDSVVQTLMFTEVSNYVNEQFISNTATFESNLQNLNASAVARRVNENASPPYGHSHVDALTAAHAPNSIEPQTAHDLTTTQRLKCNAALLERMSQSIETTQKR